MSGKSSPIVLDTGACIELEKGPRRAVYLWGILAREKTPVILPSAVLAEWWHPKVPFGNKILDAVEIEELSVELAKEAGTARAACGGIPSAVDAVVMASAAEKGAIVYTSDLPDLQKLQRHFPNVRLLSPK
jgi:predicted nucleic acid-binding protein